jgi:monofunctional glycosyltransferase
MTRIAALPTVVLMTAFLLCSLVVAAGMALGLRLREAEPESVAIVRLREAEGQETVGHTRLDLNDVPQRFRTVLVLIEDGRFFRHHGIDLRSIRFALELNVKAGQIVYGGSTITQQLARTLFLSPRQTVMRKVVEILLAIGMDYSLPKERILELYLNYAEWGPGVYGAPAASRYHFGKPLDQLGVAEQMALLTILPNPRVFTPENFGDYPVIARRFRLVAFHYWAQEHLIRFETRLERID